MLAPCYWLKFCKSIAENNLKLIYNFRILAGEEPIPGLNLPAETEEKG